MPNRDIKTSAEFLPDIQSQRLCLEDALKLRSPLVMLHALQAVASARGLQKMARDAGMTQSELVNLLADNNASRPALITETVTALLVGMTRTLATAQAARLPKNRRAGGKTGGSDER